LPESQGVEMKRWQKWHLKSSKAKNLYRKDAKYAKKQYASWVLIVFLCALCVFAVKMLLNG